MAHVSLQNSTSTVDFALVISIAAELVSHDTWTCERLLVLQDQRLQALLRHAAIHSHRGSVRRC